MEEADKVSSTAPDDGAPRDIIMNEAAAIAPTPADETQRSAEEDPPENTDLTTTEITSAPQITEITNLTTAEITSAPQMTEITNLTTPEITSAPQMTEITNVSAPQTTEETILPQRTEVTSAPQTEITSAAQMTEITNVTKAEITSAPQKAEETIIPQTTEVTAPQQTEVTSTAQMTEETINASAPQKSEESVTVTQIAEISSTWQITEETSPPEPAGDSFTPAAAAETPGAPSSCEPEPREESGSPREEEEETPPASHPEPENRTHASSEHREPSPSREPEPSAAAVAPALLQFSSDHCDYPPVASRASASLAMDPLGHKDSAAFDPDVLSQSDDDFTFETKKSPFQAFPPVSDGLEETTAARRSVEVSESPSPDLVQDAYEDGHVPPEELKPETDADAPVSLSNALSDLFSNINMASDDRPTSLPDILKSSPLNPEKLDSGSSEGSPDFSPVHKSVDDSPNSPFPVNNTFEFDCKNLLLKEMAEETEARAVERAKLEAENNSKQSFTAFDLVKETDVPPKSDDVLEDKEVTSQTAVQTADRFECLGFPGEPSDSESLSADSFSPVLDAVTQERRATQGAMDTAEEASEQEVSSEEFEFVERPPRAATEEFLEMQDSLAFSKPSEMSQDEDGSPKLEPQEAADHTPTIEAADQKSSYHILTQASDKPCPVRGKAVLESDIQDLSPAPVICPPEDKPGSEEKEAEGSMCDLSAAAVLELLYWRDVRASGLVFGCSLFFLLSLLSYSIISVLSYSTLALLTLTLLFRTYRGVLQAVQKSDEGHPFKRYLDQDVALSKDMVQRHSDVVLRRINGAVKELRRLFLVEDMIDSLKFAVFLWVLTHVGAWFNGLTLLILGLIGAFSGPIVYERHQAQIDQFILTLKSRVKDGMGQIQAKVPGAKKKSE
ncbi:reticulon-4b isoform X1 [Carassius auratus]|uniref:Reticulon n=1 Tax=Carassius auratus TaxID=7957 RepID=A0A6P6L7I6_CARAU|nr:reticulon-4-like isoform X1 [Carassius auratus]